MKNQKELLQDIREIQSIVKKDIKEVQDLAEQKSLCYLRISESQETSKRLNTNYKVFMGVQKSLSYEFEGLASGLFRQQTLVLPEIATSILRCLEFKKDLVIKVNSDYRLSDLESYLYTDKLGYSGFNENNENKIKSYMNGKHEHQLSRDEYNFLQNIITLGTVENDIYVPVERKQNKLSWGNRDYISSLAKEVREGAKVTKI